MTRALGALAAAAVALALSGASSAPALDRASAADARPVKSYLYGFPPLVHAPKRTR